ncbi:hypothetical protein [Stackebrandtia albiflava]|uniref:hypothetical protein n=1 Tax=Stackebrandtia albiflava TaxID=406432 RepID=UPI0011BF2086|nr:hypothetical protein [Stackebrandtia albiflava]
MAGQFRVDVLVGVAGECGGGVSAFFFDDGDVASCGEHEAGGAVPGVVQSYRWQWHGQGDVDGAVGDFMGVADAFPGPFVLEEATADGGVPGEEPLELLRDPFRVQGGPGRAGEQPPRTRPGVIQFPSTVLLTADV